MVDEHELHPDVTAVVAGSLQHLQNDEEQRAIKRARETKMRRAFAAIAVTFAVVLGSLGAVMMSKHNDAQRVTVASTSTASVSGSDFNARRTDLLRRIDEARSGGQLKGVMYMALLSEHQSLLVAQRRAEAHGMPDTDVRQLNSGLDRIAGQLERHLRSN
jgi:cytochrome c biogenesis factor